MARSSTLQELRLKLRAREREIDTLKSALAVYRMLFTQEELQQRVDRFNAFAPTPPEGRMESEQKS